MVLCFGDVLFGSYTSVFKTNSKGHPNGIADE